MNVGDELLFTAATKSWRQKRLWRFPNICIVLNLAADKREKARVRNLLLHLPERSKVVLVEGLVSVGVHVSGPDLQKVHV